MKIRFFINTLGGGGAEKVLVDLLKSLVKMGMECSLLTISGGVHQQALPKSVNFKQIVNIKNKFFKRIFNFIINHLPKKLLTKMYFKDSFDYEIAYLEGFPTRVIASLSKSRKKIAFVHCDVSVNNPILPVYGDKKHCLEEYKKFNRVCFVSKKALSGFEKVYGTLENSCVVHNVLDIETVVKKASLSAGFGYSTSGCKIVTVGRLTPPKKMDRLLRIASRLEKKYKFELWVVGDGELRQELNQIIIDNDIKSVKMLGFQESPYSLVKQADLFVCSSIFEGYSTAVTEALLLGVPVLTTDCAGMDELLQNDKYGWIVENSEEALEKQLEILLKESNLIDDKKKVVNEFKMQDGGLEEFLNMLKGIEA